MDGHEHRRLSDEMLQREIEAALGVDPSPEFLPRIRAQIAGAHVRDGWMWSPSWRWAGAVLAVAIAALAVVALSIRRAPIAAPAQVVSRAPLEAPRAEPGAPSAERGLPPARTDAESVERSLQPAHAEFKPAVPDPPRARAAAPEVLIAQDEAAALRHLFSAIGSGRLETKALPDLSSASAGTTEIEEIVVDPITIRPLAPLEGE